VWLTGACSGKLLDGFNGLAERYVILRGGIGGKGDLSGILSGGEAKPMRG
jgi:hypothetical protein